MQACKSWLKIQIYLTSLQKVGSLKGRPGKAVTLTDDKLKSKTNKKAKDKKDEKTNKKGKKMRR